jgi:hypothetical protein
MIILFLFIIVVILLFCLVTFSRKTLPLETTESLSVHSKYAGSDSSSDGSSGSSGNVLAKGDHIKPTIGSVPAVEPKYKNMLSSNTRNQNNIDYSGVGETGEIIVNTDNSIHKRQVTFAPMREELIYDKKTREYVDRVVTKV